MAFTVLQTNYPKIEFSFQHRMYDYGSRKEITVQRLEYTYTRYEKKKKNRRAWELFM